MIIKALSIQQPWAGFILTGKKQVENRTWQSRYIGPLLIHAGKTDGYAYSSDYKLAGIDFEASIGDRRFTRGAIVGIAYKERCVNSIGINPPTPWHDPGAIWWPLRNAMFFECPIPRNGKRMVYDAEIDPNLILCDPTTDKAMSLGRYITTIK